MLDYMPKVGTMGVDMMLRTATVQVNLDFSIRSRHGEKLRVSVALQPIATAIFANSPFPDGRPNGFLSMRSEIWRHTDAARTGMIPWAFEDGMGFERYADFALDVPMYFVKRGDSYIDVAGQSFRDLLAGRLPQLPGERATMSDWANHLSTSFPEVRLKRYLEMRGADAGPAANLVALSAFWVGLLYDGAVLDGAWNLVKDWTEPDRQALRDDAPAGARRQDRRAQRAGCGARRAGAFPRRARPPRRARSLRGGRGRLSHAHRSDSGARPAACRRPPGALSRAVGRLARPAVWGRDLIEAGSECGGLFRVSGRDVRPARVVSRFRRLPSARLCEYHTRSED
jgi:hypothetical protein